MRPNASNNSDLKIQLVPLIPIHHWSTSSEAHMRRHHWRQTMCPAHQQHTQSTRDLPPVNLVLLDHDQQGMYAKRDRPVQSCYLRQKKCRWGTSCTMHSISQTSGQRCIVCTSLRPVPRRSLPRKARQ